MNLSFNKKLIWETKISIVPQPRQSGRIGTLKKRVNGVMTHRGMMFPDPKKKAYQDSLRNSFLNNIPAIPFSGPMAIQAAFGFPFSKSDTSTKKKRQLIEDNGGWIFLAACNNDYDNLCKPLNDSMNKLIIQDDGMLSKADIIKIKCHSPFISIKLYQLTYKREILPTE